MPDVSEPSSLLSFVALPTLLFLVTLARFGAFVDAVEPVNSPDSGRRLSGAPEDVDIDVLLEGGEHKLRYPRNTTELMVAAASRADAASKPERTRAIRDLAWWTALPDLAAARGTSVRYFDHLVAEAVVLIENTPPWPAATECEEASVTQLESRSRALTVTADRVR